MPVYNYNFQRYILFGQQITDLSQNTVSTSSGKTKTKT